MQDKNCNKIFVSNGSTLTMNDIQINYLFIHKYSMQNQQFYLFSYGSNHPQQVSQRIHVDLQRLKSQAIPCRLFKYRRTFGLWSNRWQGPVANLTPVVDGSCEGVAYKVSKQQLDSMDYFEGGYTRHSVQLTNQLTKSNFTGVAYIQQFHSCTKQKPSSLYLEAISKTLKFYHTLLQSQPELIVIDLFNNDLEEIGEPAIFPFHSIKHNKIMNRQNLVNLLDQASLFENSNRLRRKQYGKLLMREIQSKQLQKQYQNSTKESEKNNLQLLIKEELQQMQTKRSQKYKLEQMFREDNQKIMQKQKNKQKNQINEQQWNTSPFDRLVIDQQQRKLRLRQKMRIQNLTNQLQESLKKEQLDVSRIAEKKQREAYLTHMQHEHLKRQNSMRLQKLKYLQQYDVQNLNEQDIERISKQSNQSYLNYLKKQAQNYKIKKKQQRLLNHQSSIPVRDFESLSPAFLGRHPYSYDRKKQLDLVDLKLGFRLNTQEILRYNPEQNLRSTRLKTQSLNPVQTERKTRYDKFFPQVDESKRSMMSNRNTLSIKK